MSSDFRGLLSAILRRATDASGDSDTFYARIHPELLAESDPDGSSTAGNVTRNEYFTPTMHPFLICP